MRIARALGYIATILTGFALVAWVALAVLTTMGGLDAIAAGGVRWLDLDSAGDPPSLAAQPSDSRDGEGSDDPEGAVDGEESSGDGAEGGADAEDGAEAGEDADDAGEPDGSVDGVDAGESDDGANSDESAEARSGRPATGGASGEAEGDEREGGSDVDADPDGDEQADGSDSDGAAAAGGVPPDIVPAVDWPELPELDGRDPVTTTARFRVYAIPTGDVLMREIANEWASVLDTTLDEVSDTMDRELTAEIGSVVFTRSYQARCPARGLAAPGEDPLVMIFVDERTPDVQIQAVLAHEIAHLLTFDDGFIGDGVLTEGVANWAAGRHALAWQGVSSWDAAARASIRAGTYVSIADDYGLNPRAGEDCIARRDRVYNARTAFVAWLIDEIGLETVLKMPVREETRRRGPDAEEEVLRLPDYSAAAGASLTQLERRWLAELLAEDDGMDMDGAIEMDDGTDADDASDVDGEVDTDDGTDADGSQDGDADARDASGSGG